MSIESVTQPVEQSSAKPFVCAECGKSYPTHSGLQGHMISHRPPVHCPECGKEYKSPGALGNHRKQLHGVPSINGQTATMPMPKVKEWEADDLVKSALALLWPTGVVPIHAILPFIKWREDTQQFLEKIK